jgi:hypothetical protein
MKRLSILLLVVLLFTACAQAPVQNEAITKYDFLAVPSEIFPFYCVGEDNKLWRVERNGAYLVDVTVSYPSANAENGFVTYLRGKDMVIFATEIAVENGKTNAKIGIVKGKNAPEIIAENVKLETLRVLDNGELLYIDRNNTLFLHRNGNVIKIEENVAQAEFAGGDTFVYRMNNGTKANGETLYPIYSSTGEYRNHLMDGLEIVAADHKNDRAYIVKSKHTVKKRTASVEVAELCVYSSGAIIFEIPSAVFSRICENRHTFFVSCNEEGQTLSYDLYYVKDNLPVKKAENIITGRYISDCDDVFAYEKEEYGQVRTYILDENGGSYSYLLGATCSLESIYYCAPYTYLFNSGSVKLLEKGKTKKAVISEINSVKAGKEGLICFKGKTPPYSVSLLKGETVQNTAGDVKSSKVTYERGFLYYYTGDGNDLNVVKENNVSTALISNVDSVIRVITYENTAAAVKRDDKTLYIVGEMGITNTSLKIKKFVSEV